MSKRYPYKKSGARPKCGNAGCDNLSSHVDAAGVGFCSSCADEDGMVRAGVTVSTYDQWWRWATIGRDADDERWECLDYGEYPEGWNQ